MRLSEAKFVKLGEMLSTIMVVMEEQQFSYAPIMYLVLSVNNRVVRQDKEGEFLHLSQFFNNANGVWLDKNNWRMLFNYVKNNKLIDSKRFQRQVR